MRGFDTAVVGWLGFLENNKGRAVTTIAKYEGCMDKLRVFLAAKGHDHLSATLDDLDEFTGIYLIRLKMSGAGRGPVIAAVRGFFDWLQRTGGRSDNPALSVVSPKLGRKLPVFMELRDAEKLLQQPDLNTFLGVRDAAMLAVLIGCGPRAGGLIGLNESSLLFSLDKNGREMLTIKFLEKGKVEQLKPAPEELRLLLRIYLGHPELQGIVRDLDDGDKVLFVSTSNRKVKPHQYFGENRRIHRKTMDDMIKKYSRSAGLPMAAAHAHALRHLFGTELAESDVNILHMKALMGHAKTDTVDIYNHTAMRKLRRESERANPLGKMHTPVSAMMRKLRGTKG